MRHINKVVAGLMFEDEYTDANGYIQYSKLSVTDNQIPQVKVSNLASSLAGKANIVNSLTAHSHQIQATCGWIHHRFQQF